MYNMGRDSAIIFVGQDGKSKLPFGKYLPVSTGVNINYKIFFR